MEPFGITKKERNNNMIDVLAKISTVFIIVVATVAVLFALTEITLNVKRKVKEWRGVKEDD